MMRFRRIFRNQSGFSLLEIIITLVVSALFGTLFIQYLGTSLTKSAEPLVHMKLSHEASEIIERMTADYKRLLITDQNPLATFENDILSGNDPENSPYYGDYTIQTDYILFDGEGNEVSDESEMRILKVSITSSDQTLTALFTR